MAPAIATQPPIECTTGGTREIVEVHAQAGEEAALGAHRGQKPSGPQHQWPKIG